MSTKENTFNYQSPESMKTEAFGETIHLRRISAFDLQRMLSYEKDADDVGIEATAARVIAGSFDDAGKRMYDWKDFKQVMGMEWGELKDLAGQILIFNDLGPSTEGNDPVKNSEPTPSD